MAKRRKYGNKETLSDDGIKFGSKKEKDRYDDLLLMQRAGEIKDLELQPRFSLIDSVKFAGTDRAKPAIRYFADFAYTDTATGQRIIEDVKSPVTKEKPSYKMKRHMMLAIHGIEVLET